MKQLAHTAETAFTEYKTMTGFWMYLMTDCVLFASLFATYFVLRPGIAGGPSGADIFDMSLVMVETLLLLTSSLTIGLTLISMRLKRRGAALGWLTATFVLGAAFLSIELYEFAKLISEGYSWQRSAFLSGYFVLVGTHGLHILIGLLWLAVLAVVLVKRGFTAKLTRQLAIFGLFWHFLDLVWIFIFTTVYLMGVS